MKAKLSKRQLPKPQKKPRSFHEETEILILRDHTMKKCPKCSLTKELKQFNKNKARHDGVSAQCRSCMSLLHKEWQSRNKDRFNQYRRNLGRGYVYGLKPEEVLGMLVKQDYRCAICGMYFDQSMKKSTFHIDHCHTTGNVRGLLCRSCNFALGFLKDDEQALLNAIEYLRRSR